MKRKLTWMCVVSLLLTQFAYSQYRSTSWDWNMAAYEKHEYTNSYGTMPYRLLLPPNQDPTIKYPLVIMLHGKGEGLGQPCSQEHGSNECNLLWGGRMHLDSINKYPSFVVFPQTGGGDWVNEKPVALLTGLMAQLLTTYNVDLDRVYIHGLSAGGSGTWNIAHLYPHLFAAVSPMSATGNTSFVSKLTYNPIWTVQGGLDTNPNPTNSINTMDIFRSYGKEVNFTLDQNVGVQQWPNPTNTLGDPIYTLVPYEGHVSWPTLYNSHSWLKWLYSQNKNKIVVIGRTTITPGETVKLGISPGFDGYEWSNGATTNDITVNTAGTYRVRYLRKAYFFSGPAEWSAWSEPVTITVRSSAWPIVNAGKDQRVEYPSTSAKLRGYGNGNGVTYKWKKLSGGSVSMGNANTNTLVLNNLEEGIYTFRLTVSDANGRFVSDDVIVKVAGENTVQAVTSFTLVNADSQTDIRTINNGDVIALSSLPTKNINIRANTDPPRVGSVRINYDASSKIEGGAPYTWFGDNDGNYSKGTLMAGSHTLWAAPYTEAVGSGTQGTALTINFTVTETAARISAEPNQLDKHDSNAVVLYPNPIVDDNFKLAFEEPQKNLRIFVYDQNGNAIHNSIFNSFGDELINYVQVQNLTPGIYRIKITSDKISNKVITVLKR